EISEIAVDEITPEKTSDFSLHQFPTTNMLTELNTGTDVEVRVFVVQPEYIPDAIEPGISASVMAAVPKMCQRIMDIIEKEPL
ncbi:MAG: coenzyme F420 hydrogenase, partial [Desulfosalsimonas sp.]